MPDPNGYETLLAAARLVTGQPPAQGIAAEATDEELRAFVTLNEKALAQAQAGFSQDSVVPLEKTESIEAHLQETDAFRQLARVLVCQAELARREGRISEALQASLNLLRLAHAVSHGGLLMDQSIGAAIQRLAIQQLEGPLLPKLSLADARSAIAELERLGRDREPVKTVANRDLNFARSRQGLPMRVAFLVNRTSLDRLRLPAIKAVEAAEQQTQARTSVLLARLALHAYALDHPGKPQPDDLQALVPSYLKEVPLAPGTKRRLTLDDIPAQPGEAQEGL